MADYYTHCEALVRVADRDRYLATLFAPAAARRHLYALYAFAAEIARVPERAHQPWPAKSACSGGAMCSAGTCAAT